MQQQMQNSLTKSVTTPVPRAPQIRARPVVLDPAFSDPDAVIELLYQQAPYKQLFGLYGSGANIYGDVKVEPWFRAF